MLVSFVASFLLVHQVLGAVPALLVIFLLALGKGLEKNWRNMALLAKQQQQKRLAYRERIEKLWVAVIMRIEWKVTVLAAVAKLSGDGLTRKEVSIHTENRPFPHAPCPDCRVHANVLNSHFLFDEILKCHLPCREKGCFCLRKLLLRQDTESSQFSVVSWNQCYICFFPRLTSATLTLSQPL